MHHYINLYYIKFYKKDKVVEFNHEASFNYFQNVPKYVIAEYEIVLIKPSPRQEVNKAVKDLFSKETYKIDEISIKLIKIFLNKIDSNFIDLITEVFETKFLYQTFNTNKNNLFFKEKELTM